MSASQAPTVPPAEHLARLSDHAAWLRTGRSLLGAADLIWPKMQEAFDLMDANSAALQRARDYGGIDEMLRMGKTLNAPSIPFLMERARYGGCYLLTAGYGIENLLKAVRVKRLTTEQKPIRFGGSDDQLPKHHNRYVDMAKRELRTLTTEETAFLVRLSVFVTWAGRYPASVDPPSVEEWNRYVDRPDKANVDAIAERLVAKYDSL